MRPVAEVTQGRERDWLLGTGPFSQATSFSLLAEHASHHINNLLSLLAFCSDRTNMKSSPWRSHVYSRQDPHPRFSRPAAAGAARNVAEVQDIRCSSFVWRPASDERSNFLN